MRKKIVIFILIAVMLLPCAFAFTACNRTGAGSDLVLTGGNRPQYSSLFSEDRQATVTAGLRLGATEEQKKAAVIALFDTANDSRKNTSLSLMLQQSNAGISRGDVVMHAFNLKAGDKWYYQLATEVSTGNPISDALLSGFAGFLKVAYRDASGDYWYSMIQGAETECDCKVETFPYASYVLTQPPVKYDEASFKEELHYLDSMHEINNMQFCAEIIADGARLTYNRSQRFYRVEFSVNMKADKTLLKQWYAMPQKDMQVSGHSISRYIYYNAVLEVWDNGYAKSFRSESSRDAGVASGSPVDEFSYIWNADEIMGLLREDARVGSSLGLMRSPEEYVDYYSGSEAVSAKMSKTLISLIVSLTLIGVIVLVCVVDTIVINVLIRKGKLPKLAQKREARKQRRLARKEAKQAQKNKSPYNNVIEYEVEGEAKADEPSYLIDEQEELTPFEIVEDEPDDGEDEEASEEDFIDEIE